MRALLVLVLLGGAARGEVLHERVSVGDVRCSNGVCWRDGRPGEGATGILSDGELVPAPGGGAQPNGDEPVYTPGNAGAGGGETGAPAEPPPGDLPPMRRPHVSMDRDTGPEPPGKRVYHEPFNPAVFPFKRMSALDAVAPDETLVLSEHGRTMKPLEVLGADRRTVDRDAFWGSVVIDFEPGRWVPLPSVAADSRVLAYRAEPALPVSFARDGADNYYVSSPRGGRHRLVWLTDAPTRYFAGELPGAVTLGEEPRALLPALPPATRKRAQAVLARLGVDTRPGAPLVHELATLVSWFRAFQPAPSNGQTPVTASAYDDLALGQKGSCRHRSYAFVITALAAGIPARYVENELHVFVEVFVPRVGWRRINLGGALVHEEVAQADGKVPYRPKGDDGLPAPPPFTAGGDAEPPTPPALQAARRDSDGQAKNGGGGKGASGHSNGGGSGPGTGSRGGGGESGVERIDLDALDKPGGQRDSVAPAVVTRISVTMAQHDAFRGDKVAVTGEVASTDGQPGGLPVEIYLDGPGGALRLADVVADARGHFAVSFEVPKDLPLGDHRVVARTPGDAKRLPSRSR